MDDVKIEFEKMSETRVRSGAGPYRAHIMLGDGIHHSAEGDTPQQALVLAAMRWDRFSNARR